ncbi:MAG TPA: aspartate kinase [Elusimicrobia bacterium]|nr:aspartate kinase [Elusimicrobiota bacterium]HBT61539.1 aspartate kinase [Elusimicrobiota bacterium]
MNILVMKFGGTSVADPEKIQRAADRAIAARRRGQAVVVVVSAPGEMTDELLTLAHRVAPEPEGRELDQLLATGEVVGISLFAMACRARGAAAVSLTGPQAGIEAGGAHTRAQIVRIRTGKILKELRAGRIVTVAGFQGVNPAEDVATLGRGGSDLTAVALASALRTRQVEIFSDVKGVYTADPRLVSEARKLDRITGEEMLELAGAGAQVMQPRSIEVAERFRVAIHVRSAFHPQAGTWIVPKEKNMLEKAYVSALALDKNEVRLNVMDVPDRPGVAAEVLSTLAELHIPVDMIVQSAPSRSGVNDISLMTPRTFAAQAREALAKLARRLGARVDIHDEVAKVSAVGTGFRHHPWVAAKMFEALAAHKINIHMIVASDLRVSCVVDLKHAESALRALHKALGLARKRRPD